MDWTEADRYRARRAANTARRRAARRAMGLPASAPTSPERSTAATANKQAAKLGVAGVLRARDVRALWQRQPVCLNCGTGRGLDHIVPMVRGGSNTPDNIQNLCVVCNQAKHTQDLAPGQIAKPPFPGDAVRCRRGHPRETSMRTSPSGHRYCLPCHRIHDGRPESRDTGRRIQAEVAA